MFWNFNIAAVTGFLGWAALGIFLALLPSMAESVLAGSGTLTSGLIVGSVLIISAACQLIAPVLHPAQRAGITAALYIAFYAGVGVPAIAVGMISMATPLLNATMFVNLVLLLAIIIFIPVPSIVQTTIRRSDLTHATFSADYS